MRHSEHYAGVRGHRICPLGKILSARETRGRLHALENISRAEINKAVSSKRVNYTYERLQNTVQKVTCENDGVEAGFAPQLHEVNHVPEAQGRVTGEDDARLAEVAAEVSVDAGVVLQLVGLDQLTSRTTTTQDRILFIARQRSFLLQCHSCYALLIQFHISSAIFSLAKQRGSSRLTSA